MVCCCGSVVDVGVVSRCAEEVDVVVGFDAGLVVSHVVVAEESFPVDVEVVQSFFEVV